MKGIRFYADLPGTSTFDANNLLIEGLPKRTTRAELREMADAGRHVNCIAVLLGDEHRSPDYSQECLSSVFIHPNLYRNHTSATRLIRMGFAQIVVGLTNN